MTCALDTNVRQLASAMGGDQRAQNTRLTAIEASIRDYPSVVDLLADSKAYSVGTVLRARAEGYVYEVVAANPHITRTDGLMLRVRPEDGRWSFGALMPVGDGVADDRPKFVLANTIGGEMYLPRPAVAYNLSTPLVLNGVTVIPDAYTSLAKLTSNGALDWLGGKTSSTGARITRLADRVFIGRAAPRFAGNSLAGDAGYSFFSSTTDGPAYLPINSALVVESGPSQYGIAACVRTSELTGVSGIGLGSAIVNDKAGARAWGWIAEIQHEGGALNSNGFELAVKNKSGVNTTYTPYQAVSGVFGGRIVAGGDALFGGAANAPSTAALIIIRNSENGNTWGWNSGIVFRNDAIQGVDGTAADTGTGSAISMARGHAIDWHAPTGGRAVRVTSRVTDAAKGHMVLFVDDAVVFQSESAALAPIVRFQSVASAVNYIQIANGASGGPVTITATGPDSNIGIRLIPKGTGLVQFGTYAAQALTPTGYITIRDANGIDRRILVG